MNKISLKAYGKVNLSLDIVGKKENGYHLVDMVLHSVGIFDLITITKIKDESIIIKCNKDNIPLDKSNIIYKAAQAFFDYTKIVPAVIINLIKNIPLEAGMGGGSADAAATLIGLNELFDTKLDNNVLKNIGLSLGADVPFCIDGGSARAQGIGEKLTKLSTINIPILVVKPQYGVSTVEAYKAVKLDCLVDKPNNAKLIEAMENQDIEEMIQHMGNVFYSISSELVPSIQGVLETMSQQKGCKKAIMSGSGSTVFGIFEDEQLAESGAKAFKGNGNQVFCTHTVNQGISFTKEDI